MTRTETAGEEVAYCTAELIVEGAIVATLSEAMDVHTPGAIAVADGVLVAVGDTADVARHRGPETRSIDASGSILIPGLINTHCHAGDALFRGLVEDLPLEPWLERVWHVESSILDSETATLGATIGLAENALAGVTTVFDMFFYPVETAEAALALGLRIATGGIFFDGTGVDGIDEAERFDAARAFFNRFENEDRVLPALAPHGAYTVRPETLERVAQLAESQGCLITIHAAETRAEQAVVGERYGRSVLHHLDDVGLLGPRTTLAHCVHLTDTEIDALTRTGAHVAHNPASNLKLGSGVAPVPRLLSNDVNVTLGTDGPISGNDLDPWLALRLAATLHKGTSGDPTAVSAQQALAMSTTNAARALGLEREIGSLEVGKRADFVILEADRPHAAPLYDVHNHLVFATSRADVRDVFVGGRQVVENRTLLHCDWAAVAGRMRELSPNVEKCLRSYVPK